MASVTVDLGNGTITTTCWNPDDVDLGATFAADGVGQTLGQKHGCISAVSLAGTVNLSMTDDNDRFTPAFEATGRIIFEASDGETLEVTIGNADMSEPYNWTPSNSDEVIAFGPRHVTLAH